MVDRPIKGYTGTRALLHQGVNGKCIGIVVQYLVEPASGPKQLPTEPDLDSASIVIGNMCRQRHVVMAVVSACSMLLCIAVNRKEDFTPDVKSVDTKDDRARTASWQVGLYWIASGMLAEIVKLASSRINQHPYFLDSASITAAPFYLLRMLYQYAQRRKHVRC